MDAVSAAIDALGDRWTLLILRDVMVSDRRHFRALLTGSVEGIASNILADRLVKLVDAGLLVRGTAARGQRARYSLTEAGIQSLPLIAALGAWGSEWRDGAQLSLPSADELRGRHLITPAEETTMEP